jgi:hypothetical protein
MKLSRNVLAAFDVMLEIEAERTLDRWEADGGRRQEYMDCVDRIYEAANVAVWDISPAHIDRETAPVWVEAQPELLARWSTAQQQYAAEQLPLCAMLEHTQV